MTKSPNAKCLLGTLTKIDDLRKVWPEEASYFTKWLAEEQNLKLLSGEVGINLELDGTESSVGDFRADIVCHITGTGDTVIIENQLGESDHNHLGKIITYASGTDAKAAIWIVKSAREEHASAIEWLNDHTDISFFLIETELWKIGNSEPAPKFNVIERPNNWKNTERREQNARKKLCLAFWEFLLNTSSNIEDFKKSGLKIGSPQPQSYTLINILHPNTRVKLAFPTQKKEISASLYFMNDDVQKNLAAYSRAMKYKEELASTFKQQLTWSEGEKYCVATAVKEADMADPKTWPESAAWLCSQALKWKELLDSHEEILG